MLGYAIKRRAAQPEPEEPKQEAIKKLREQARAVIVAYPGWNALPNLAARTGPLFEELGLIDAAADAYGKYMKESDSPSSHQPLAAMYIRQKQADKVLALAREYEKLRPGAAHRPPDDRGGHRPAPTRTRRRRSRCGSTGRSAAPASPSWRPG